MQTDVTYPLVQGLCLQTDVTYPLVKRLCLYLRVSDHNNSHSCTTNLQQRHAIG